MMTMKEAGDVDEVFSGTLLVFRFLLLTLYYDYSNIYLPIDYMYNYHRNHYELVLRGPGPHLPYHPATTTTKEAGDTISLLSSLHYTNIYVQIDDYHHDHHKVHGHHITLLQLG
jgi:hypothetical protein